MVKKNLLLLFTSLLVALGGSAQVSVCGVYPDESGQVSSPYIKSGTVTWDATSQTLTLDNAVIEYSSNNSQDGFRPIRVTDNATIVVKGDCRLTTTGYVAIALDGYISKNVVIKGNGTLSTSSSWIDIFLVTAHLTIQDITLNTVNGIANNAEGTGVALTFDNVQATIQGGVSRIGEGITFNNCAITYPEDAYLEQTGYGYCIYYGNHQSPDEIIISRNGSSMKGDVNNDGEVNIADVNALISMILGAASYQNADVNGDGEVNIADVNMVIYIILYGPLGSDGHEYVDLGLPSGTLWATCNVGANSPEEYGDYFAWGETAPKDTYTGRNYKWYGGSWYNYSRSITKYCTDSEYGYNGFVDNKTELDPEDDAAYVNWGPAWRTPSFEQIDELSDCPAEWTQRNGVNGALITGPNGKTLFLPAAGYCSDDSLEDPDFIGLYWSRNLSSSPNFAYCLSLESEGCGWWHFYRDCGFSVRAVRVSQN